MRAKSKPLKWTKPAVLKEASKHKTKKSFREKARGAEHAAMRNGWYEEATAHMIPVISPPPKWNYESVKKVAQSCKTKQEFNKKASGAVQAAKRNGWYEAVCDHMEPLGNKYYRCNYAIINFAMNAVYVGLTGNFKRRILQHKLGTQQSTKEISSHADTEFIMLTDYVKQSEAIEKEGDYIEYFIGQNFTILNRIKHGGLGSGTRKWTKEALELEAKKYTTRGEFFLSNSGAYGQAHRYGLIDEICAHMQPVRKYWSDEEVFEAAKKYESGRDFKQNDYLAYSVAVRREILNDACFHMPKTVSWDLDSLNEEAVKYQTRAEFLKNNSKAYHSAAKKGVLDKICRHMRSAKGRDSKWTKELVVELSTKFQSRRDFRAKCRGAYQAAVKYKWLDNICPHLPPKKKWTLDKVKEEALKYKATKDFAKGCPGGYSAASKNAWLNEINKHFESAKPRPKKWSLERVSKEALKYKTKMEFKKENKGAYQAAVNNKWLESTCEHMIGLNRWSKNTVLEESKQFKTRTEFMEKSRGAYAYAERRGFLTEACSHMRKVVRWSHESAKHEALKYSTRGEFQLKCRGAYAYAKKHAILDDICQHMVDKRRS